MSELTDQISNKLIDLYPNLSIKIVHNLKNRAVVFVNDKKVTEFNPNILQKELEFLGDRPDYLDLFIEAIKEPIENFVKKLRRGPKSRGLTLQQVKEAITNTKSCRQAARYLYVSEPTFKKYAKMYTDENGITLYDKHKNQFGVGISKGSHSATFGRYSLQDIFDGKASPHYPSFRLKERMIQNGVIEEKCAICGFEERRITDYKIPLVLDYIDGDETNKKRENLRLLCYNCYFLNTGDFFWRRSERREHKKITKATA